MDSSGNIYGDCPKCGKVLLWDRKCEDCDETSGAAEEIAKLTKDAIENEIPDPLARIREQLLKKISDSDGRDRPASKPEPEEPDDDPT